MTDTITTSTGGATVTIDRDASEKLAAGGKQEVTVTDARGRLLTLRKPSVLAQFDLIDALGDTAKNEVFMAMSLPLLFVATIDGTPVAPPASRGELNVLIQRLDEDGLQAVMTAVLENFGGVDQATVKNG